MSERKKARRGRGEGSAIKRPDGTWQGRLSAGTNPDGSRRRIFVNAPTKHECLDLLAKRRSQLMQGALVGHDDVTVEGFLLRWLENQKRLVSGATVDSYERNIRKWINPEIGTVRLQKLDAVHVECVLNRIITAECSPTLAKYNRTILRKALRDAIKAGVITRNVTDMVDAPTPRPPEIKIWDEAQTLRAIEACENERLGAITAIGLLCGARQGEILALQWPDIDFKHSRIHIRRTQSTEAGKIILKRPKTKSGARTVEFTERLGSILRAHKARMMSEGWLKQPFVFVDPEGQMLDRFGDVKSSFIRICKAAKNPQIGFHSTRHTHATLMLRAGVNPKVVQERLGHSTVQVTLQLYSHVIPAMQADAVQRLDKLLG